MTNQVETQVRDAAELDLNALDAVAGGAGAETFEPNCRKAGGTPTEIIVVCGA